MPYTVNKEALIQTNSTTYADLLGVEVGLERLPGESADQFLDRVRQASKANRSASYEGLMNEIMLNLGLQPVNAIEIEAASDAAAGVTITVDLAGVHLVYGGLTANVPLVVRGNEDFWSWRRYSDVVADINELPGLSATLRFQDGPALQLVRQSNVRLVVAEPIAGKTVVLKNAGMVRGAEQFNIKVPDYTYAGNNTLQFSRNVPEGTQITYQCRQLPYTLIASPAMLASPLTADFAAIAKTKAGTGLIYQAREFLQQVFSQDRSYWGR